MVLTQNLKAVYLSAEDINIASSLLYLAYHDDPFFLACFESEKDGYEQRLRSAIREELLIFWDKSQPMVGIYNDDENLLAVACLIQPGIEFGAQRFWHWRLKMMLTTGYVSTRSMIEKEDKVRQAIPAEHYHLLAFIAVHPHHQHHGVGHYLMKAVDTMVNEQKNSEGVGVLVTVEHYQKFFADANYQKIKDLQVGKVPCQLMFKFK
ncbi:GNAT family N-acetyltransferase [Catenovulum sp. 2E275]|uniref:GNAT family N-acetyltransferase n=1 Tax=Catenovulum sp. 2E275 TaxID=2980497 RepID=UPI0021D36916|nr:GNAT family N-acetyltransferase [Catenovulum sp. 2E275]MCU4676508.1 GNAT family N-acetyltransferase [Catenovulum sp. 2E275]